MARTVGGLIPFVALLAFLAAAFPGAARASSNASYDAAMAACSSYIAGKPGYACYLQGSAALCWVNPPKGGGVIWAAKEPPSGSNVWGCASWFTFAGAPPSPCESAQPYVASYGDGAISVCRGGCMYEPDPSDSTTDTVRSGPWLAQLKQGTYRPTGKECAANAPPEPPFASGKICGGGSCHDTAAGEYCANDSSGAQFCVSDKPPPSGGCASSGDTTLCVGNPPPMPPNPPIVDPVTGIAASDTYGHQQGNGAISNTTVNNYNGSGAQASNGAASGDAGNAPGSANPKPGGNNDPAHSSSTGKAGDGTTASGGGDCSSPPICEGSQATCMVVKQTYLLRCPGGTGDQSNDGDTSVPGLDGVPTTPDPGIFKSETVLDKLDAGGFGGGTTCPKFPAIVIPMFNIDYEDSPPGWCDMLDAAGKVIMLLAAFISLRILSEK